MEKIIPNKKITGTLRAPESKSYAHRYLIASALSGEKSSVVITNESDDVMATKQGIEAIVSAKENGEAATVWCKDSGSTFRFLLPIASALGVDTKFMISKTLATRPTEPLYLNLKSHGATLKTLDYEDSCCLRIRDCITPGEYEIQGNISSQFISGLLFALPLLHNDSTLSVKGDMQSKSYVDMTIAVLREANIEIIEEPTDEMEDVHAFYRIPGNQKYYLEGEKTIEGDWSNAAFWLTAGALSGPVTCTGLNLNSLQGDMEIINILKGFGANVETDGDSVTVSKAPMKAIDIDLADIPDLIPEIALLDYASEGETHIKNTERLKFKESNRVKTVQSIVDKLKEDNGEDMIETECFADHRIAMMAAVAACTAKKPVKIIGAEAVSKSYPGFFDQLEKLM